MLSVILTTYASTVPTGTVTDSNPSPATVYVTSLRMVTPEPESSTKVWPVGVLPDSSSAMGGITTSSPAAVTLNPGAPAPKAAASMLRPPAWLVWNVRSTVTGSPDPETTSVTATVCPSGPEVTVLTVTSLVPAMAPLLVRRSVAPSTG